MYVLPSASEHTLALTTSTTENLDMLATNSAVHTVNKMHQHGLHRPAANFSISQMRVYTTGIKQYTKSPSRLNVYTLAVNKSK
jgi:uracil phosphoribosyltransferase